MIFNDTCVPEFEVSKNNSQWIHNFKLPSMVCCIVMYFRLIIVNYFPTTV